jgi:multidrug efflux system membrane fusion protein
VRLHVGELGDALLVRQTATGSNQIGRFVYVLGPDNRVDQRYVSLGPTDDDLVVATKGVSEADHIIVGNLQKVGPGTLVQPGSEQQAQS